MKAAAAARRSINSTVGLQKSFPAADHNDNIIHTVGITHCECVHMRVCIMRHDGIVRGNCNGA